MMDSSIRIGTRGSQLALWQANHIAALLREQGHTVEIEIIRTTGDRMQVPGFVPVQPAADEPSLDAKGIFIKEIEDALAAGRVDVAVHSLKDLPTVLDPRFLLAAIPPRADARDVWVCEQWWALHTLPEGGRIGTTSPRRQAQLLALRPDVQFVEIRGNIDTRLRKLEQGECEALVLAAAGLDRLGRAEWVHQRFAPEEMCPAPGQGALALEVRHSDHALATDGGLGREARIVEAIAALDHASTRFAVEAERHLLHALGGGCQLPIGALCRRTESGGYHLIAQVVAPDGEASVELEEHGLRTDTPVSLGQRAAQRLIERNALDLLQQLV